MGSSSTPPSLSLESVAEVAAVEARRKSVREMARLGDAKLLEEEVVIKLRAMARRLTTTRRARVEQVEVEAAGAKAARVRDNDIL